jgi:hypothetical protein
MDFTVDQFIAELKNQLEAEMEKLGIELKVKSGDTSLAIYFDRESDWYRAPVYIELTYGDAPKIIVHSVEMVPFANGWVHPEFGPGKPDDTEFDTIQDLCAACLTRINDIAPWYLSREGNNCSTDDTFVSAWYDISDAIVSVSDDVKWPLEITCERTGHLDTLSFAMPGESHWKIVFDYGPENVDPITLFVDETKISTGVFEHEAAYIMFEKAKDKLVKWDAVATYKL